MKYDHKAIEPKWQQFWESHKKFRAEDISDKPKYYALDMFPYPSGAGLHVGHPLGYTATDIMSRYKRHKGFNVLHPMGWDAFGLPAENYAIKTGVHPKISTAENEANFKRQIQALGFSYDWERCFSTTDPDYYKWSQWIFLQLFKKGLAYEEAKAMNWCPKCKIVAANEEVEQGMHERCGSPVEKRNLKQWMFRITDYAERLLNDLEELTEWPEKIKAMQRNWIGKSEGAEVDFEIKGEKVSVYTTRPDTLFGATYFVMSPEHPLVDEITTEEQQAAVQAYKAEVAAKSDLERTELNKDKSGVFTGAFTINPATNQPIPVWIADYVLMSYGTGAIMAVPAHDERDLEFAEKFGLQITEVVSGLDDPFQKSGGKLVNSEFLDGLTVEESIPTMIQWLEDNGKGTKKTNYKLRDWIFTRQRYWGEPIPLVFDENGKVYALDDSQLPLELPETPNYEPSADGQSPLAKIEEWVNVIGYETESGTVVIVEDEKSPQPPLTRGSLKRFTRETSTMPNWAGSSWYWLRFMDPHNEQEFCSKEKEQYWGPVDLYVGGAEHAVLHLLYGRFWHKVLFDLGLVSTIEPFKALVNQGMIAAEDGRKMSKSLGNVINPDDVIAEYGADTLRCYEMFMGPFEQGKAWSMGSVGGIRKWLERVTRVFEKEEANATIDKKVLSTMHKTIKQVGENIEEFKFNTAVSQMMVLTNELTAIDKVPTDVLEKFAVILSPFAPHLAEELYANLGHEDGLTYVTWPIYDEQYLVEDTVTYAVQVNGKLRAEMPLPADTSKDAAIAAAKDIENVAKWLSEGEVMKEIFVPGKIVGFVVK
ncbi:leucine--tRNA ligase [bacterium]|nr:leucine--tRNA ligase [bacterium]NCQ55540.1 leucine--tRNA ligase [Candidatus Parcubacteria bacterium]NCS67551.1 leucine--tRNA ligase [Candidatus Peregrinibacteria bacterium]NCS96284.1 leucine--tRNA ligase [bacterium]